MNVMEFTKRTFNVDNYSIFLDRKPVDENAAREAWRLLMKATGRTPVTEPEILSNYDVDYDVIRYSIVGKIIDYQTDRTIRLTCPHPTKLTIFDFPKKDW